MGILYFQLTFTTSCITADMPEKKSALSWIFSLIFDAVRHNVAGFKFPSNNFEIRLKFDIFISCKK